MTSFEVNGGEPVFPVVGEWFKASEFASGVIPEPSEFYIGDGILPKRSKLILFAPPKIGKSILVNQMARELSLSHPFLSKYPLTQVIDVDSGDIVHSVRVAIFQMEIAPGEFQKRLRGKDFGAVYIRNAFNLKYCYPQMEKEVKILAEVVKPDIVIFDPLFKIFLGNFNEAEDVQKFQDWIDSLISLLNCSVVVVHHARKQGEFDKGIEEAMGSVLITAFYDSILTMRKEGEDVVKLGFVLRNAIRPVLDVLLRLNRKIVEFEVIGEVDSDKEDPSLGELIVSLVRSGVTKTSAITQALSTKASEHSVRTYLTSLVRTGTLVRTGRGEYNLGGKK